MECVWFVEYKLGASSFSSDARFDETTNTFKFKNANFYPSNEVQVLILTAKKYFIS